MEQQFDDIDEFLNCVKEQIPENLIFETLYCAYRIDPKFIQLIKNIIIESVLNPYTLSLYFTHKRIQNVELYNVELYNGVCGCSEICIEIISTGLILNSVCTKDTYRYDDTKKITTYTNHIGTIDDLQKIFNTYLRPYSFELYKMIDIIIYTIFVEYVSEQVKKLHLLTLKDALAIFYLRRKSTASTDLIPPSIKNTIIPILANNRMVRHILDFI